MKITFNLERCLDCRHMHILQHPSWLAACNYEGVQEGLIGMDKVVDRYSTPEWCPLKHGKPY